MDPKPPLLVFHTCETCRIFKTKSLAVMDKHLESHRTAPASRCAVPIEPHRCSCSYETHLLVDLRSHPRRSHELLFCRGCGFSTHSLLVLLRHKRQCQEKKYSKLVYECGYCFFKCKMRQSLQRHVISKHTPSWMYCASCNYRTSVKQTLVRHIIAKHTAPKHIKWLQCELCEYRAKRRDHLMTHVRCMHPREGEVFLQCEKCPYRTTQKDRMQKHELCKHSSDYGFHCAHCDYKSKLKYHLITHIRNQHPLPGDVQWLECADCAFRTNGKQELRKHIVMEHTKPRTELESQNRRKEKGGRVRFECGECGYTGKSREHLVRHMRKHGVK